MNQAYKKYFAEFLGTLGLVFFGTGAICIDVISNGMIGHAGIAMAFGLAVIAMIYAFGEISGAHINPAVTIAFWLAKRFEGKAVLPYIAAQLLGALAGSLLLLLLFPELSDYGSTLPKFSVWQSFLLEVILSYFLMLVILHVSTGSKEKGVLAGLAIGLTVGLEALIGGPISGASMNPFRSIAPAIVSGNYQSLWLYIASPVIGMVLATLSCKFLQEKEDKTQP